jgi:MoxR-like ATPase
MEARISDQELNDISHAYEKIREEITRFIVGNENLLQILFIGLLAEGHVLVEGIPGTAKSTLAKATARLTGCEFRRVQSGIDTQPADVIGVHIWDAQKREFVLRKGPIFTNILLIDEINRLPPKSQSAFLEAMGEQQVTIDGITIPLERPYIAIATLDPLERQGTFPLIEAQKDRFMFSHRSGFLGRDDELAIVHREHSGLLDWPGYLASLAPVLTKADLIRFSDAVRNVHIEDAILSYIRDLVMATREHADIELGVSARGSIALVRGAKVLASIENRPYVIPDDVKKLAPFAFQHRLLLSPNAEIAGISPAQIVDEILKSIEVP